MNTTLNEGHSMTTMQDSMTVAIERITPDDAQAAIDGSSSKNRGVSKRNVDKIAKAMVEGRFLFNGEALIHDSEGNILDGQHRYHACVKSWVPFTSIVVRGVDPAAFTTIDTGRARTAGDVLSIDGKRHSNELASAIRAVMIYRTGRLMVGPTNGTPFANDEVLEFARDNPDMEASVQWSSSIPRPGNRFPLQPLTVSQVAWVAFECNDREDEARRFFEAVAEGANLAERSPELAARKYLNTVVATPPGRRAHRTLILSAVVNALNARLQGREVIRAQSSKVGTKFPKIGAAA